MSRSKKVWIALNLSFALIYFLWILAIPPLKYLALKRTSEGLYEIALAKKDLFSKLTQEEQESLQEGYQNLALKMPPPYFQELKNAISHETHPLSLVWLLSALAVSFLLIYRVKNAEKLVWILPFLSLLYGFFSMQTQTQRNAFFPDPDYVLTNFGRLDDNILSNKEKLLKGWHRYLITEWAHETPEEDVTIFETQLEKGLYAFNIARLKWIQAGNSSEVLLIGLQNRPSIFKILFYLLWNLLFAWRMNKRSKSGVESGLNLSEVR